MNLEIKEYNKEAYFYFKNHILFNWDTSMYHGSPYEIMTCEIFEENSFEENPYYKNVYFILTLIFKNNDMCDFEILCFTPNVDDQETDKSKFISYFLSKDPSFTFRLDYAKYIKDDY